MKRSRYITKTLLWLCVAIGLLPIASCEKLLMDDEPQADYRSTFQYLWSKFDENYTLFDVKNIDWDSVYNVYSPRVDSVESDAELFDLLAAMLNTLDDGHVNLFYNANASTSELIYNNGYRRSNIDYDVVAANYLTYQRHSRGGFRYNSIDSGKVLYINYSSFSSSASTATLEAIFTEYDTCLGTILDMRQNGGGSLTNVWNILTLMPSRGQLLYRTQIKNGKSHHDFAPIEEKYAPSNSSHTPYAKPVVVLIDRGSYSATSFFALSSMTYPNITLVGDTTGGGLGLPTCGMLPNGWYYRHPITRTLAPDGTNYENGVPPDTVVLLSPQATAQGRDNVIDCACQMITTQAR